MTRYYRVETLSGCVNDKILQGVVLITTYYRVEILPGCVNDTILHGGDTPRVC